jgi:hypothetical protein
VVAGATRGVADRTAQRNAIDAETQARATYEGTAEYQNAQRLNVELIANFGFTVSADSANPADTFLLTFDASNPLKMRGTVSATNLSAGLNVGFLSTQISNGSVTLSAEVDATITASQPLQVSALQGAPSSLLTLAPTSSLTATLPVTATIGTFSPTGSLTVMDNDLFGSTPPSVSFDNNFGTNFATFTNLTASQVLSNLNDLTSFLNQLSNSSVLSTQLPFAQGQTLGTALNLGTALTNELGLGTAPANVSPTSFLETVDPTGKFVEAKFTTVQDLVTDLANALNVNQTLVNVQYDSTSQNLTFAVDFKFKIPEVRVPFSITFMPADLAPLGNLSSSDTLTLDADGEIKFSFGFNLAPDAPRRAHYPE